MVKLLVKNKTRIDEIIQHVNEGTGSLLCSGKKRRRRRKSKRKSPLKCQFCAKAFS